MSEDTSDNSSASKRSTPGPFFREHSPIASDEVIFRHTGAVKDVPVCHAVALLYETVEPAEREELVDLLNKGTHFDRMREALEKVIEWQDEGRMLGHDGLLLVGIEERIRAVLALSKPDD